VYIDGRLYYDRQTDLKQKAEDLKEKAKLIAAEKAEKKASPPEKEPRKGPEESVALPPGLPIPPADAKPVSLPDRLLPKMAATSKSAGVLAIVNANIYPISRPAIPRGSILIREGKIEAIGADIKIPSGAKRIDVNGSQVYPGWIDAKSSVGLTEPGPRGYQDNAEMLDFNPQLRTIVAYHNDSENIPPARANGVTTVAVFPLGGILGGQVPVMDLDGWTWEESTLEPLVGISFQFPSVENRFRFSFGASNEPERTYEDLKKERDAKLDRLAGLLDQVRSYMVTPAEKRQTDWVLESLIPVITRRIPLLISATGEQEIKDAVAFGEKVRVKMVICTGAEAAITASLLKEKKIPVILESVQSLPTREDMFHAASYTAAGELYRAGVRFAFAADDDTNVRLLPYQAAQSIAWGLPREEALRALTLQAAEILGIADRVGSLDVGKTANLLIAKGDPLEVRTEVTQVIIRGKLVDLADKQSALYERYSRRP
jgi:imidazolonepropionase-like amidohydrolase